MYLITDFGALADGRTVNTAAIQAAVDACTAAGGGTVLVPPGTFVTGTIWLRDHVELHLEKGAILLGSPNLDDYNADDAFAQNMRSEREQWNGAHLILAVEVTDVALTGSGCIDGNGPAFFETEAPPYPPRFGWSQGIRHARDKERLRPGQMLLFCECSDVRVSGLTLRNACCWTCLFYGCEDVVATGLRIDNPPDAANTDGIDIDCCRQVVVSDCLIRTGDDAITLRANPQRLKDKTRACEDVAISNCVLDTSICAFRIGVGTGVIRHAAIANIVVRRASTAFLLQSAYLPPSTGVAISDLAISNIQLHSVAFPLKIVSGAPSATAPIEDIRVNGLYGSCYGNCEISGSKLTRPRRISISHVDVTVGPCPLDPAPAVYPDTFLRVSRADAVALDHVRIAWRDQHPSWRRSRAVEDATVAIADTCDLSEPT
ncbi:MAG: hypothetical protein GX617_06650 [Lentisphaerae bacterium]|nr:hypothetical protein [Lentisphaerota bacterium]